MANPPPPPQFACLFWFYKSPELCENRLRIFRRHNPDTPIYGLFGGNPTEAHLFEQRLAPWLDDFYVFIQKRTSHWKWYHGDQMIMDWFRQRGQRLNWDTVFIAQWDMLVFDALSNQFSMLKKDELLLSGLRPVSQVDPWWYYVRPNSPEREEYERFIDYVRVRHEFELSIQPLGLDNYAGLMWNQLSPNSRQALRWYRHMPFSKNKAVS